LGGQFLSGAGDIEKRIGQRNDRATGLALKVGNRLLQRHGIVEGAGIAAARADDAS